MIMYILIGLIWLIGAIIEVHTRIVNGDLIAYNHETKHTGEVVGFISGNNNKLDKLVIADDITKHFVKVNMADCKIIDDAES